MTKGKYKVVAATGFDGHQQGEEFEAELDEDLEARAVERGSLEVIREPKRKEKTEDA